MQIALTVPNAGAGKWAWMGWLNAFNELGHNAFIINNSIANRKDIDIVICSTSCPSEDIIKWRENNLDKKLALNVLAWTNEDLPCINNPGVQATEGNVWYAKQLKPDIVFAQYFEKWREILLSNWRDREGYKLGSMGMAADSTVYEKGNVNYEYQYDFTFVGGFWHYKSQIITPWLLPVIDKFRKKSILIGGGWPRTTDYDRTEKEIGKLYQNSKFSPNIHEPHSHYGYDIVERGMKVPYCGGLLLSDYVEEMISIGFIHENNCLLAKTPKEYMDLACVIVEDPSKFDEIRRTGIEFISQNHTYIHRVQRLLKDLNE